MRVGGTRPVPSDFQTCVYLSSAFGFSDALTICVTESVFVGSAHDAADKKSRYLEGQTNGENNPKSQTEELKVTALKNVSPQMSPQPCGLGRALVAPVHWLGPG